MYGLGVGVSRRLVQDVDDFGEDAELVLNAVARAFNTACPAKRTSMRTRVTAREVHGWSVIRICAWLECDSERVGESAWE